MLKDRIDIRLATHEGSRIVTYLPGGSGRGFFDACAFWIETLEQRA